MSPIQFASKRTVFLHGLGLLLCVSILLSACGTPPTPAPTPVVIDLNQLYANPWTLVAYGDPADPTIIEEGASLTAEFTTDSKVNGFGGCNTYSGTYQAATDGTMTVGPLATTRMVCPNNMEEETAYLTALQSAQNFRFNDQGRLEIAYESETGKELTLSFVVGEKPLTGTNWVLVSMGDPASQQAVPEGTIITAVFSPDGIVSGLSGCNQYSASYTLKEDLLTLGPIAVTQMLCPSGIETEQAYLEALGIAQQVTIVGPKLTITYDDGAGLLTYASADLPLEYTVWSLSMMNGQPVELEANITAMFTPTETPDTGNITGYSGCNYYNAAYTLADTTLTIQPAALTMMACPEGMDMEQTYLETLQASTSYQVFANRLVLTGPAGSMTFTANRTPLSGALWMLVSIGDVTNPEIPVEGSRFAAQFSRVPGAPSGILTGTTGCNEYSASYAASIEEIKINLPVSTKNKSCVPGLTEQEELFFLALSDATTFRITGNTLVIPYDDDKQALVFEGTQIEEAERPPLNALNGTTWYLWFINGAPLASGSSIYGQFAVNSDGASGTFSGSAGCNGYVATFGDNLGVQATLNSNKVCSEPPGVMDQEGNYIQMLSRAFGYWQTDDQLIINTGAGVLTYRTTQPPESYDQTHLLAGPNWFLISYNDSYSSAGSQEPFTQFNTNGTLTGYTGCNNFQASYSTDVQIITITNLTWDQINCPSSELDAQEEAMLDILRTARSFQVVDTAMQITGDLGVLNYSLTPLNRPEEVKPPVAAFTGPTDVPVGQVATFDGSSSSGEVPIVYWEWDFGDGSTATGPIVSHVYATPGAVRVKLTVTDQRGYQDAEEKTVNATGSTQPTPIPTQTPPPTPTGQPPTPTSPAPQPTATSPAPQPTPTVAPTQPPVAPPQASIQGPTSGYVGEPVTFDASGSTGSGSLTYAWTFGDGSSAGPSENPTVRTLYSQPGTYQASVVVTDQSSQSSSAAMSITIGARLETVVWSLDDVIPGTAITLQFLGGQVTGFSSCNSYNGGYTAVDNGNGTYSVTITGLTSTSMACPGDVMGQESGYLAILGSVTDAQIQGNVLTLNSPQGSLTYHQVGTPK